MPQTHYPQAEGGVVRVPGPGAGPEVGRPSPGPEVELSPALVGELLDPAAWQEGLEKYALAMHLAVAFVGTDGRLIGPCLNPQPLWGLLRARRPAGAGDCPFAVAPPRPCTCVADALRQGRVARARDRTGLVHFAVPLVLGEQRLGALVAGQVFDRYPEQLLLEQAARQLGLAPGEVWEKARREHPVSPTMLRVYEDLLVTLGGALLEGRHHACLERDRLAELERAQAALRRANDELERRVEERTAELREAQRKALQAERLAAVGQMAAGLAHESRNALQRNQACLSVLTLKLEGRPEELELLARMQRAQDDLHRLYEEVREYAGPMRLQVRACRLADLWREAWDDLAPQRAGKPAELREEAGCGDWECLADPFHLQQVFRNLFENALAAAGEPARVEVRCSAARLEGWEAVQVAVRDNGPGFTPDQRHRLFEPFHTTKVKGTGLGLAICKRVVEAHGGRIEAGEGPGGEVVITLARRTA